MSPSAFFPLALEQGWGWGILLGPHCCFRPQIRISCYRTTRPRNPHCCPCTGHTTALSFLCLRVQLLAHRLQQQPCLRPRQRCSGSSTLPPRRPATSLCPSSTTPETWALSTTVHNLYESPFLPHYLLPFHSSSSRTPAPPTAGPSKISWPLVTIHATALHYEQSAFSTALPTPGLQQVQLCLGCT